MKVITYKMYSNNLICCYILCGYKSNILPGIELFRLTLNDSWYIVHYHYRFTDAIYINKEI